MGCLRTRVVISNHERGDDNHAVRQPLLPIARPSSQRPVSRARPIRPPSPAFPPAGLALPLWREGVAVAG
jgi:hypothetical protein